VTASEQLLTVLFTAAVPTIAVLIGILVNDLRWNELARTFDAASTHTNRDIHNLRYVRHADRTHLQR
jgi:hypothetical protein